IKLRLRQMDFMNIDIDCMEYEPGVFEEEPLTEHGWNLLAPALSKMTMNSRVWRLLNLYISPATDSCNSNMLSIVTSRCTLTNKWYISYKRSIVPSRWRELPFTSTGAVFCLPLVKQIIGLPDAVDVTAGDVQNALTKEAFTEELSNILKTIKISLSLSQSDQIWPPSSPQPDQLDLDAPTEDLAIVQAKCSTCGQVCSSIHTFLQHLMGLCYMRLDVMLARKEFTSNHEESYMTVSCGSLFETRAALSLIEATFGKCRMRDVKADEMDDRGEWYQCLRCSEGEGSVGTWRECILHTFEGDSCGSIPNTMHKSLRDPGFEILGHEDAERMGLRDERKCWLCARCDVNVGELWTREMAEKHSKEEHQVWNLAFRWTSITQLGMRSLKLVRRVL
ncbi:hypothetical protein AAF712_016295, partial [Marasmius tenuissimus]